MEYKYRYETHLHTCEASACGILPGAEYVKLYKDMGYTGIIVTDHFFNGNCAIPKDLPWEERVNLFCLGYEHAKEEGDKQGFQVLFGWEDNFQNDEYLVYGLDKKWLLNHPDMLSWTHQEHIEKIHAGGGLVVQAHPFRERAYISNINLHPFHADAVEVSNMGNPAHQDVLAYYYSKKFNLPITSGSDIHSAASAVNGCFGMNFSEPLGDIHDYVERVKSGKGYDIITEEKRLVLPDGINDVTEIGTGLPINFHEYNGEYRRIELTDLFAK